MPSIGSCIFIRPSILHIPAVESLRRGSSTARTRRVWPEITGQSSLKRRKSNASTINWTKLVVQTCREELRCVWWLGTCPSPPVRRGNQGQIPAVYSRSLCQLLRKSERTPPAGCQREVDVMSVGMGLRGQRRERAEFFQTTCTRWVRAGSGLWRYLVSEQKKWGRRRQADVWQQASDPRRGGGTTWGSGLYQIQSHETASRGRGQKVTSHEIRLIQDAVFL